MRTFQFSFIVVLAACIGSLSGCGPKSATTSTPEPAAETGTAHDHDQPHDHDHPHEGPHHGTLVELGDHAYHAEVVHDAESVTVYMLGSTAEKQVPIDTEEMTINVMHDDAPKQFTLKASPDSNDPAGESSRFIIEDAELVGHLDNASAAPKLSVTIDGTAYQGEIKHDHDHEGHDHAH